MYEYQMMDSSGGYEYVVRGAEVSCKYGSKICVLNLQRDHGVYTSDGRPLITVGDSKINNISGFLGNASAALFAVALIIAFLPKTVLEKIRTEMYKNTEESLIIKLYDVPDKYNKKSKGYNIKEFKVETWQSYSISKDNNIFGEKYLLGTFHTFPYIDINIEKINAIHNSIERIFNNIDGTL